MGYIGLTPTSVWIWRPSAIQVQDSYKTLVTAFESGAEQRRGKWARPRMRVTMRFDKAALTNDDVADIWRFYQKQRGNLYPFLLPLFGRLTAVASAYTVGSKTLWVDDTQDFTTSATSRWNLIYLQSVVGGNYDVFTITSVTGATRIEVQSATGNAYGIGDPVAPVITARFEGDMMSPEFLPAYLTNLGLSFTEVRS